MATVQHINPPFPSLDEFLTSRAWKLVSTHRVRREWFHPTFGRMSEEEAIEVTYTKHWQHVHPDWVPEVK